jgi:hypothetical protein
MHAVVAAAARPIGTKALRTRRERVGSSSCRTVFAIKCSCRKGTAVAKPSPETA